MTTFVVTAEQMAIFMIILLVGFMLGKIGIADERFLPKYAQIITKVLLPVTTFYGTVSYATVQRIVDYLPIIVFAAVFYALVIPLTLGAAKLMRLPHDRDRVFSFCFTFGNTGFVGIPLMVALFPETGIIMLMMFTLVDQAIFWTVGIWLSTARDRSSHFSARNLLTPNIIALVLALVFVFAGWGVPPVIGPALSTLNNATSACAMLYLGMLMYFSDWKRAFKSKDLYVGMALKMVLIPIVAGHVLSLLPLSHEMVFGMVVLASLPVMTVVPMIAAQNGNEGEYAAGITVATLIVSVVSIPLVQLLAFL